MTRTKRKASAVLACSLALTASLAVPCASWAYASSSSGGDAFAGVSDIAYAQDYVDEDEDGYDDRTDEKIPAQAVSAASSGSAASGAQSGASAAQGAASSSSSTSAQARSGSTASGAAGASAQAQDSSSSSSTDSAKADGKSGGSAPKDAAKEKEATSSAFTFAGTGTTVDNATSGDGVEFFTIRAADDQVYYLVVDRNSGADNVYLLDAVKGSDLEALAKDGKINLGAPAIAAPAEEKKADSEEKEQPHQQGAPEWLAYLAVVAVVGGGAFVYYRLKVKPEREESRVDEREVRSFEDDGIYPPSGFEQHGNWGA